jgi:LysM repeat protein
MYILFVLLFFSDALISYVSSSPFTFARTILRDKQSSRVRLFNPAIALANHRFDAKDIHFISSYRRVTMGQYTIAAGDSFSSVAGKLGTTTQAIATLNPGTVPTNLQIGQIISVPGERSRRRQQYEAASATQCQATYIVQAGDTFYSVALICGSTIAQVEALNPGVNPSTLQVGQAINVPTPLGSIPPCSPPSQQCGSGVQSVGGTFVTYFGSASSFPNPNLWASYNTLWGTNSKLMQYNDSPDEVQIIGNAILSVAQASGVDARAILCLVMQESGGNLRVSSTSSWEGVHNTGIMQAHNGVSFNQYNPVGSIQQMIVDGTMGTSSGDGLLQCLQHQGNYYAAFREYNSGRNGVNLQNLNDGMGATGNYVNDMANRLMGHIWDGM